MSNPRVNEKSEGDNGYIALYRSKKAEVYAKTSYEAQQLAAKFFKAKKAEEIRDVLGAKTIAKVIKASQESIGGIQNAK